LICNLFHILSNSSFTYFPFIQCCVVWVSDKVSLINYSEDMMVMSSGGSIAYSGIWRWLKTQTDMYVHLTY
jgi:hypothetical protein